MAPLSKRSIDRTEMAAAQTAADPRWAVVIARDRGHDGTFVCAVKTTRIYCRPSCPSRRPKPQNVVFYATCDEAERRGFRACKRCHPRLPPASAATAPGIRPMPAGTSR